MLPSEQNARIGYYHHTPASDVDAGHVLVREVWSATRNVQITMRAFRDLFGFMPSIFELRKIGCDVLRLRREAPEADHA